MDARGVLRVSRNYSLRHSGKRGPVRSYITGVTRDGWKRTMYGMGNGRLSQQLEACSLAKPMTIAEVFVVYERQRFFTCAINEAGFR